MIKSKKCFNAIILLISLFIFLLTCFPVVDSTEPANNPPVVNASGKPAVTVPDGYNSSLFGINESVLTLPSSIDGGYRPIGKAYDITYNGGSIDFSPFKALLTFTYNNNDLAGSGLLNEFVVFYYDNGSSSWKRADKTYVNISNNTVTAETSHFTTFVLTAMPSSGSTAVQSPPANILNDYPTGIGGSCGALFTIIDENFKYYQDRDYYIRPVSSSVINQTTFNALGFYGALGIATANGYNGTGINLGPYSAHKLYTGDNYIVFTAHKDMDIYLMYDTRGGANDNDISRDAPWLSSQGFSADISTTLIPAPTRYFIETTDAAGKYRVYRKSVNLGEVVHLHGNRKGVTAGGIQTNYWIILKSKNNYNNEPAGTMASNPDSTPPAKVSNLTANQDASAITLNWTNPSVSDFAGVVIRRSTTGFPANVADGTAPIGIVLSPESFIDQNVVLGNTYYYAVFALDVNQNYQAGGTTIQVYYLASSSSSSSSFSSVSSISSSSSESSSSSIYSSSLSSSSGSSASAGSASSSSSSSGPAIWGTARWGTDKW